MNKEMIQNYIIAVVATAVIAWPIFSDQVGLLNSIACYAAILLWLLAFMHVDKARGATLKVWVVTSVVLNFTSPIVVAFAQDWAPENRVVSVLIWAILGSICTFLIAYYRGLRVNA